MQVETGRYKDERKQYKSWERKKKDRKKERRKDEKTHNLDVSP